MNTESKYCFARSAVVPIRSKATDAAEMVNQLILGETAAILEKTDRWLRIKTDFDEYEGWINLSQVELLEEDNYRQWISDPDRCRSPYYRFFIKNEQEVLSVPSGAMIRLDGDRVKVATRSYQTVGVVQKMKGADVLETAKGFLGTPYLWGGRTDLGIDCSGLVQTAFALHGYRLPRDSGVQFKITSNVFTNWEQAGRGDVAYFSTSGTKITHVGFYAGEGLLLHASGNVKYSRVASGETDKTDYPFEERLANGLVGIQRANEIRENCKAIPYNTST